MKIAIITMGLLLGSFNTHAQSKMPVFNNEKYLTECGGKVYSKCDKDTLNQATIYAEAKKLALDTKRLILINVGADWCPACVIMNEVLKAGGDEFLKINEKFVFVKFNADANTFKAMKIAYNWPGVGYPNMVVVDPATDGAIISFYPTTANTLAGIRAEIAKRMAMTTSKAASPIAYKWFPTTPSKPKDALDLSVRPELLIRPIAIDAKTQILKPKVTIPEGPKREQALAYYTQGLFYLYGFHWVDAARSFRTAIMIEPNFYSAYVVLSMALGELYIIDGNDESLNPLMVARKIAEKNKVSEAEKEFAKYLELYLCESAEYTCKQFGIAPVGENYERVEKARKWAFEIAHSAQDPDLMALVSRQNAADLEEILKISPNNPGVHHYLIHQYEGQNEYRKAASHAAKFVELAPQIAHSHHMYGHILPKMGKWKDAVARFLKADEIHQAWFVKNQAYPWEDWHYEHNLNLLAHAYFFGGEMSKAEEYWKRRCEDLKHLPCEEYFSFLILVGRGSEAEKLIKSYWIDPMSAKGGYDAKAAEIMSNELLSLSALMRSQNVQQAKIVLTKMAMNPIAGHGDKRLKLLNSVVNFNKTTEEVDSITKELQGNLSGGGFDSWSAAIFETEFLIRLASKLGFKSLASSIELSKQAVGFRCK